MFVTLYILLSPGSCTIWLGETSWHGLDPGGHTKGLFPTSSPLPSPTPMQDVAVLCLLQRSIWLLLAFGALFGLCRWCCFRERFRAFVRRVWCLSEVVVGGCGWCLSFGALGFARPAFIFFVLVVLPLLLCFSSSWWLGLAMVLLVVAVGACDREDED